METRTDDLARQAQWMARALAYRDRPDRPKRAMHEILDELHTPPLDHEIARTLSISRWFAEDGEDPARVAAILACWYRTNPAMAEANLHRVAASMNTRRLAALTALLEQAAAVQPTVSSSDAELLRICELAKDAVISELALDGIDTQRVTALLDAWNIELRGLGMPEGWEAEINITDEERRERHQGLVRRAPSRRPTSDLPALIFHLDALLCAESMSKTPLEEVVRQMGKDGIDLEAARKSFAQFEECLRVVQHPEA